jgi:FkbM family methyltransferase
MSSSSSSSAVPTAAIAAVPNSRLYTIVLQYLSKNLIRNGANANVVIVDIGATEGTDWLMQLVRDYTCCKAVLVEPIPQTFERLKANSASIGSRAMVLNAAVKPLNKPEDKMEMTQVNIDEAMASMKGTTTIASLEGLASCIHVRGDIRAFLGNEKLVSKISVPALTLEEIYTRAGLTTTATTTDEHANILHVNVNGFEMVVLSQVDFDNVATRPSVVLVNVENLFVFEFDRLVKSFGQIYEIVEKVNGYLVAYSTPK